MKRFDKVVFIGFMGSGKSHAAKELSELTGWRLLESDDIIERREKKTITKIFKDKGESYFRTIESKVIKDLLVKPQTIISLGGGAVCRKVNRSLIKKRAFVIWMNVTPDTIHKRTAKVKKRPLLEVDDPKKVIEELMTEREAFYKQCAHVILDNNSGIVINKLKKLPEIKQLMVKLKKAKKV
ncbi:MAG: shikimate kinase [Candidatus Omnitrophota bacterium]|jgi:shikimate kinase